MKKRRTGVLFVCHGNICRSPLAEGVFRRLVDEAGLMADFDIDSAGVSGYHAGEAPDPRTVAEAQTRGLELEHSARRVRPEDLARFDYVLTMDGDNQDAVERIAGSLGPAAGVGSVAATATGGATIRLLRSFDRMAGPDAEVPDPYYGGDRGFADVHDMVERACRGLLEHVQSTSASVREDV